MQRSAESSYAAKNSSGESTLYTLFQPPPLCGLRNAGKPTYSKIPSQFNGYSKLRMESPVVPGGCLLWGRRTVGGMATPSLVAREKLKNLSSALQQNGV